MPQTNLSPGEEIPTDNEFSLAQEGQTQPEESENINWLDIPRVGYLPEQEWKMKGPRGGDHVQP